MISVAPSIRQSSSANNVKQARTNEAFTSLKRVPSPFSKVFCTTSGYHRTRVGEDVFEIYRYLSLKYFFQSIFSPTLHRTFQEIVVIAFNPRFAPALHCAAAGFSEQSLYSERERSIKIEYRFSPSRSTSRLLNSWGVLSDLSPSKENKKNLVLERK